MIEDSKNVVIEIAFYDTKLLVSEYNGKKYVGAKIVAEAIGLDWKSQYVVLTNDASFGNGCITIPVLDTNKHIQNTLWLDIKYLNGWLFRINPNKVKSSIKPKLIKYQQECYDVLYGYFNNPRKFILSLYKRIEKLEEVKDALLLKNDELEKDVDDLMKQCSYEGKMRISAYLANQHCKEAEEAIKQGVYLEYCGKCGMELSKIHKDIYNTHPTKIRSIDPKTKIETLYNIYPIELLKDYFKTR
jgi:hypothetical protein